MRIAVVGTGANGASIGADLTRAGLDVTFIEQWPAHVAAMRADGVRIDMPDGSETTRVRVFDLCEVATLRETFDVVLLLVKAYDTVWSLELIKPLLAPDGVVVGMQNGMTIDAIASVVGPQRTVGSVIEIASTMFDPGVVRRDTTRALTWYAIGAEDPVAARRLDELAEVLRHSGRVEISADIRSSKWMKLVANATELVPSAILDMTVMEAVEVPGMHEFMVEAGREAARTAVALGHRLVPIFGLTEGEELDPETFPEQLLAIVHDVFSVPGQMTTVLQDWVKGRRSEVDQLNGLVVDEARRLGRDAPVNARVQSVARRIEAGGLERSPSNASLLLEP